MPYGRYVSPEFQTLPFPALAMGKTGEPEELLVAGAVSVLTEPSQLNIDDASNVAFTLADGDETQRKLIYMTGKADTGNAVLTPANLTGGTTITFDTVGEYALLRFLAGSWVVVATTATVA